MLMKVTGASFLTLFVKALLKAQKTHQGHPVDPNEALIRDLDFIYLSSIEEIRGRENEMLHCGIS